MGEDGARPLGWVDTVCHNLYLPSDLAMTAYPLAFARARQIVDALESHLTSEATLQADPADIEAHLQTQGQEIVRQLLQGHLDYRAAVEELTPCNGADGHTRAEVRPGGRPLMTLFGEVRVSRCALFDRHAPGGLRPMDASLNLPPDRYSFGLRQRVVETAFGSSYDEVVAHIDTTCAGHVPKRQAENLVLASAVDVLDFYNLQPLTPAAPAALVVLSFDGKGVVMLTDGLRPATRKKAETEPRRLRHRISPGEKPNRKRSAQVATVYELPPVPRTPEDIIRPVGVEGPTRPRPQNKRIWASLVQDPLAVIGDAFAEALRRDEAMAHPWVVLVDGCPHQLRRIEQTATSYGVAVFLVLDIIHVAERLWKAAWCLFATGDPGAEAWVSQRLVRLLEGKVSGVAAGMRRSATHRGLSKAKRKGIDQCANYLLKYKRLLRYDLALARGYPIATGVIEGACRHLIKDRMDRTGARWGLAGGEAILQLRSVAKSGDLKEYWRFHRQRELERNHLRHFADHELEPLRRAA